MTSKSSKRELAARRNRQDCDDNAGRSRQPASSTGSVFTSPRMSTVIASKQTKHLICHLIHLICFARLNASAATENPNKSLAISQAPISHNISSSSSSSLVAYAEDEGKSENIIQLADYLNHSPSESLLPPQMSNMFRLRQESAARNEFSAPLNGGHNNTTASPQEKPSVQPEKLQQRALAGPPENKSEQLADTYAAEESRSSLIHAATMQNESLISSTTTSTTTTGKPLTIAQTPKSDKSTKEIETSPEGRTEEPRLDEFTPDILHDNHHESDKLANQQILHESRPREHSWQRFTSPGSGFNQPKLEHSGWLPSSEVEETNKIKIVDYDKQSRSQKKKSKENQSKNTSNRQLNRVAADSSEARAGRKLNNPQPVVIGSLGIAENQESAELPAEGFNSFDGNKKTNSYQLDGEQLSNHFLLSQSFPPPQTQAHLPFQSSLKAKHVPPPTSSNFPLYIEPQQQPLQQQQQVDNWQKIRLTADTPISNFLLHPPPLLPSRPGYPIVELEEPSTRAPFVASLKNGRGFNRLLPRLTAKLFKQTDKPSGEDQLDILNQQQSFSMPTHLNSPTASLAPLQTAGRSKIFSPKGAVKSLFSRDQSNARIPLLSYVGNKKPNQAVGSDQTNNFEPPPSRLILMNGQVYSVLSAAAGSGSRLQDNSLGGSVFDHQTSDTSEFPVFEAMSMQHMMSSPSAPSILAGGSELTQSSTSSSTRCDRPRHVIQADRTVVNHILQSQQNFVIARVPIKKFIRPELSAPTLYQTPTSASHIYHAFPVGGGGGVAPPSPYFRPGAGMNYAFANTNPVPTTMYGNPQTAAGSTIEVTVPRSSLFQSLANLVNTIRYGRSPMQAHPVQATRLVAGSSPNAVYVEGPVILSRGSDQLDRRFSQKRRSLLKQGSKFILSTMDSHLRQPPTSFGSKTLAPDNLFAASSQSNQIDPMRRLLMLKTATDNEVCSPVSDEGPKIKYSCIPNHCVAMAIANSTAHFADSNLAYKASNSMQQDHYRHQSNQDDRVRVEQFDDFQPHPPVVTYTHINAYQPPVIAKLAQPQHQQFVTSSQSLNAMANLGSPDGTGLSSDDEEDFEAYRKSSKVLYQPHGQASNIPVDPTTVQLMYMQYPMLQYGTTSTKRPRSSRASQQPSVTYGTAYIRTSPVPDAFRPEVTERPAVKYRPLVTREPYEDNVNEGPPSSDEIDSGEFSSAVDEQLERPISVSGGGGDSGGSRRQRYKKASTGNTNRWRPQTTSRRPALQHGTPVENGGSGAENSLIESEAPGAYQPYSYHVRGQYNEEPLHKQRRGTTSSNQTELAPGRYRAQQEPDHGDYEDEDDGDEGSADYGNGGSPGYSARSQPVDFGGQNSQQQLNMNKTIPVSRQQVQDGRRKTRRENRRTTQVPNGRYGLRQSTPLPAPEKSEEAPEMNSLGGTNYQSGDNNNDDDEEDNNSQHNPNGYGNNTECDCANKTNGTSDQSGVFNRNLPETGRQQLNSPHRRNPTTLRPSKFATRADYSVTLAPTDQQNGSRDRRRQTIPTSTTSTAAPIQTGAGMVRYTTRRPYNLRLTTYKNLAPNATSSLLVPSGAAGSYTHEQPGDVSTTTSTLSNQQQAADDSHYANNQTQFDDAAAGQNPMELPGHYVTYNEPEVQTHPSLQSVSSLLPATVSETYQGESRIDNSTAHNRKARGRARNRPQALAILSSANFSTTTPSPERGSFKPSSVNDIVAQARRQSKNGTGMAQIEMSGSQRRRHEEQGQLSLAREAAEVPKQLKSLANLSKPLDISDEDSDPEGRDEGDSSVTPHQYQIQIRWSNITGSEKVAAPSELAKTRTGKSLSSGKEGEQELLLDRMRERVKDRLFEHREEEHWHDKKWLRGAKKRKLVGNRWVVVPLEETSGGGGQHDYGPSASTRETPLKGSQLSNEPSEEETERHFAIPTANFRQSAKFVNWVQKPVNMEEEPGAEGLG